MPYYNDVPYYYGASYANHSSLMTGTGRPFTPLSRFSPHLSTISESPLSHLHRFAPISARHPRRVIDTADIDVSTPRILSHDNSRPRNRLRRDRPTIKIRSQALKDNPALRGHHERHDKSVGELLMEKFLIKDVKKKSSDEGQQQPMRMYHQVSLESDESGEALHKRVTRRFTRRRSSTDLDQEQLQREATYAQVQAKVLDSLVAEEQAQIESEARRGTLIRKGTVRGPVNGHSYYSNNSADSDTMTREEEEAAALRARKTAKKAKRKKKPSDKPSPPDKAAVNTTDIRRSSTSSEISTDSKNEEDLEENGPRPQMYKIEACNSAGDFSTIWMNASENETQCKLSVEQFRESVRVPIPRKPGSTDATAAAKNADEAETLVILPVRKPYVKDSSRNSVYLTMKKPLEKLHDERLDEKLGGGFETDSKKVDGTERLANGFVDASTNRVLEDDVQKSSTCDDESELNGEVRSADDVKDVAFKRTAGKLKRSEDPSTKKKDARAIPKSLDNDVSRVKRDTVILKTKDDVAREVDTKSESLKSTETTSVSSSSVESTIASTSARAKQSGSSKDAVDTKSKKDNESRKDEDATNAAKKNLEAIAAIKTKTPQAIASSKDVLDENLKKDNENQKNEVATSAAKKNLEATTTVKPSETVAPSKDSLSAKKDDENRKNEDAIDGVVKKNLEAVTTTKTSEPLISSQDSLSTDMKRDNENQKNENAIGITKNLETTTTFKTPEALASSKDALSAHMKKDNENRKNENATGVTKKNLKAITRNKTSEALVSPQDVLSANTKKDENQKSENAIGVTKKNLETVITAKTAEALISSKDSLSASMKKDDENQKNENITGVTKKNQQAITRTKTSEALVSPQDSLSANMKKDNENQKNENAIGVTKKNLEAVTTTKTAEALISPKDSLSGNMKKDNENQKNENITGITKKNLQAIIKTKTSEALVSPQNSLSANLKKDNENRKNEIATVATKKNLETAITTKTKSSEVLASPKDALSAATKKDEEHRKDEISSGATKKNLEAAVAIPEALAASKMDKLAEEEVRGTSDTPKIPAMSHEDVTTTTTRRSVVTNAGDTCENSASIATMPTPSATGLPKASKINADRNNAVEAPELSLREAAAYLASESPANKSERRVAAEEDVVVGVTALPGKNKASNLAKKNASGPDAPPKKAIGVDEAGELARVHRDDAAKLKSDGATLPEGVNGEVRSNERNETTKAGDVKPTKDTGLTKTPRYKAGVASRELSSETTSSSAPPLAPPAKSEAEATITNAPSEASEDAKPLKIDVKKVSAVDVAKDSSSDSGVSSPKGKVSKLGGAESKFPFKVKTLQKSVPNEVGKDSSAPKAAKNDDGKAPTAAKRDTDAPKILKKSTSVDSKSTSDLSNANLPTKALQQSVSVDERAADKSMPVKKPLEKLLESSKFPSKVPEKKPATSIDAGCAKPESTGQLSKSASTESIDFWSEIKAPDSPRATRSNQKQSAAPAGDAVSPRTEQKTDPISGPKRVSSDSPARGKPAIKELGEKKNEGDVKISVAPGATAAVAADDVAEERRAKEKAAVPPTEPPRPKAEKSAQQQTKALRVKKKTGNLSIAIGAKEPSSTVKKAPTKREDAATSTSSPADPDKTPTQSDSATPDSSSTVSTPLAVLDVPVINIVEVPKLPGSEGQNVDHEDHEDVSTPTNELPGPALTKISKWSNRNDLTNADDAETPVASEEASLAASPAVSPQSSKTKRTAKKKKPSSKKPSTKADKETTKRAGNEIANQQSAPTAKPQLSDKLLLAKPSPKGSPMSSPRNSPSQRPLDLIRMFYTTPSALLTATPRDLSKVRRAKIKRRKHQSRTPSVSSDSTGSTTSSTATTESTDGSGSTCTELDDDAEHKRMNSTRSNDSGFDGSPRISTPSQSSDNQRNSDSSDHFSSGRITPPATNLPRFKKYTVTDFNFLKVLGKGSFGKVLLAELRGTECVYAVKCLKKDVVLEDDDVECTLIERKVLTLATRHPYLCHLFCTFQTDSHLFFVMEYLNGGDLMFHIQKSGRFPEARARFYAAEIWSGLNFLHKKGIVYRDLKLDNVLLDFDGHIRIADFGMCKLQIFLDRTADTFCGTPDYMAPEIIKGLKYNQAVDWWSFGVLLYEMLTGQSPFSGCDEDELFWSICNERPFIPRYLSQEATDMLVCLLEKDSGKRPPGHEIAMHAFFQHLPWDRLERRQLEAPFKPALEHTLDTRYFDTAFTTERPRLTPIPEQILTSMDQGVFRGFSYTNPNATD